MNGPTDPRPAFAAATAWVDELVAHVPEARLADPTPCPELDVAGLCAHLVATVRRAAAAAAGADVLAVEPWAQPHDRESYRASADEARALWADDAVLTRPVRVPWGEVPGAGALWGYVNEQVVHGWDLAVATGQPAEADPGLVAAASAFAERFIGPDRAGVPFGDVVEPRPGAGPTERLANWCGRSSQGWVG